MPTEVIEITPDTTIVLGSFIALFVMAFFFVWSIEAAIAIYFQAKE